MAKTTQAKWDAMRNALEAKIDKAAVEWSKRQADSGPAYDIAELLALQILQRKIHFRQPDHVERIKKLLDAHYAQRELNG